VVAAIAAHGAAAQTLEVHGSGTTNPSKFFWDIMDSFMAMTRRDIRLTYRAVGSSTGQREFTQSSDNDYTAGLTDFGSGDIPMTNARWQGLQTAGRGAVHVPFALGAIGIFHSVPEGEVGAQGLKLKPCVLAKIFSGAITEWTDPEIAVDNPGISRNGRHPSRDENPGRAPKPGLKQYLGRVGIPGRCHGGRWLHSRLDAGLGLYVDLANGTRTYQLPSSGGLGWDDRPHRFD